MPQMKFEKPIEDARYVLAGYGLPAELGLNVLFGLGVPPANVLLLTHPFDLRNAGLRSTATLRQMSVIESRPNEPAVISTISDFAADILISIHYRYHIPISVLDSLPLGGVNLHPSLLPKYRGSNAIPWGIISEESHVGYTFHRMAECFDSGKILLQRPVAIEPHDTAFSLFHKLSHLALSELEVVVRKMFAKEPGTEQASGGSFFDRKLPFNGIIDPTWDRSQIDRFIRAMYFPPFPAASYCVEGIQYSISSIEDFDLLQEKLRRKEK